MNNEHNLNLLRAANWDVDKAMGDLGGIEMYEEILADFYSENLDRVKKIIEYKKTNDLKNYTIEVHAMKSECMYLGINHLAEMCFEQQLKGEAGDIEFINQNFDALMTEIAKALTFIKEYLGK